MYISGTLSLLKYRLFARHKKGHGIHSPFVFNLITKIFRNKSNADIVLLIEKIRKKRKLDKRLVKVSDLGAGSMKMKGSLRKISDITRYSAVPEKYGLLLYNLSAEFGRKSIIEFGTSTGISTMYLASGNPDSVVITMEGCDMISSIARENFKEAGLTNISLLTGSFDDLIPEVFEKAGTPGLVFIDGNHRKDAVVKYFYEVCKIADDNTVVVIDDIHSSYEMESAWADIREIENVTITVDIFRMGIVFFRQGVSCANYVIKY